MKVDKKNILKTFKLFSNMYLDFNKKVETEEKTREMINSWLEVLETVEIDYEDINEYFEKASKIVVAKNKYIPTVAEIVEEMRNLYTNKSRQMNFKEVDTSQLTDDEYELLMKGKITMEELIKKGRVHV